MELKVWVEGIQRIVCGVTEDTTCQASVAYYSLMVCLLLSSYMKIYNIVAIRMWCTL